MKTYSQRECLTCGKIIHESAYSGKDGNFRKHLKSHEGKDDEMRSDRQHDTPAPRQRN
jgi:hypothetical protein